MLGALCASAIAVLVLGFFVRTAQAQVGDGPLTDPIDFTAFYCAGRAVAAHADPYRVEPLRSCERAALAESHLTAVPNLVVPAPLPPYALTVFTLLSPFSFRAACTIWLVLLAAATGGSIALVARLSSQPLVAVFAGLILSEGYASVLIGQVVPLVICALCVAAVALRARRYGLAAVAAAATLVEPHLAVPVCIALGIFVPRSRRLLAILVVGLAAVSLAAGWPRWLEYVTQVLPAQARGEGLEWDAQYGLSALTHQLGAAPGFALELGSLSYIAMVVAGVVLANRLARAYGDEAFIALTPPALALVGGPYVHVHQMAAAIPLAFLLLRHVPRSRAMLLAAICCLAVPWQSLTELPAFGFLFSHNHFINPAPFLARVSDPNALAQAPWNAWIATMGNRDGRTPLEIVLTKLPTWFGLLALWWCAQRSLAPRARLRAAASA